MRRVYTPLRYTCVSESSFGTLMSRAQNYLGRARARTRAHPQGGSRTSDGWYYRTAEV